MVASRRAASGAVDGFCRSRRDMGFYFFLQVPSHEKLLRAFDRAAHQFLVRSNWLRTLLWSARALLLLFLIGAALSQ